MYTHLHILTVCHQSTIFMRETVVFSIVFQKSRFLIFLNLLAISIFSYMFQDYEGSVLAQIPILTLLPSRQRIVDNLTQCHRVLQDHNEN